MEGRRGAARRKTRRWPRPSSIAVAQSSLAVSNSEAKRLEAWVGYLTLSAPFDGMIVARNANTFDFVQPTTGDPTANVRSPYLSPSGTSAPIYVVDRTDIVRIFVDIPEQDANDVQIGSKANLLVKAYRDEPIPGTVTRTAWAPQHQEPDPSGLRIDLPNPGSKLLPGMYAYAKVILERPGVQSLPATALTQSGDKTFCWTFKDGHAQRTEVRTGISDGEWIEADELLPGPQDLGGGRSVEAMRRARKRSSSATSRSSPKACCPSRSPRVRTNPRSPPPPPIPATEPTDRRSNDQDGRSGLPERPAASRAQGPGRSFNSHLFYLINIFNENFE